VANITEIFERLSYYGAFASLALYLQEKLNFSTQQTGTLTGIFGGMVGSWPSSRSRRGQAGLSPRTLDGLPDPRRSLFPDWLDRSFLACAHSQLHAARLFVGCILMLPALGIALVKPCVVGTTARASKENVRSIGYSIYYTMVNIGGASGPYVAPGRTAISASKTSFGLPRSACSRCFCGAALFPRPKRKTDEPAPRISATLGNFITVVSNARFMLFLLIFTGYWIVFWQQYTSLPGYIHTYISAKADVELILITDALVVICLTSS